MRTLRRLVKIAAGALAFLVYVWFGGVLNAARAKRRKAMRRALRLRSR